MKIVIFFAMLFCFSSLAFSQTDKPIIGKLSDLSGKKSLYISAETTQSRERIEKVFAKDKTFQIVGDAEKADFIVEFKTIEKSQPTQIGASEFTDIGEIEVYFFNSEKRKVIAWSKTKNFYTGWGIRKDNETFLSKEFLKEIKKK